MKLEEAIKRLEQMKNSLIIEEYDYGWVMALEKAIKYIKEESIPKAMVEEKIEEINKLLPDIDYHDIEDKQEREFYRKEYMKQICAKYVLQEILNKGENK